MVLRYIYYLKDENELLLYWQWC